MSQDTHHNRKVSELADWEKDCIMTVEDFKENVSSGLFIDYDGHAHPIINEVILGNVWIYPRDHKKTLPKEATHVAWYNR